MEHTDMHLEDDGDRRRAHEAFSRRSERSRASHAAKRETIARGMVERLADMIPVGMTYRNRDTFYDAVVKLFYEHACKPAQRTLTGADRRALWAASALLWADGQYHQPELTTAQRVLLGGAA